MAGSPGTCPFSTIPGSSNWPPIHSTGDLEECPHDRGFFDRAIVEQAKELTADRRLAAALMSPHLTNDDLLEARFFDTRAHSGERWSRNPTCWRYMDLLSLLTILQNECLHFTRLRDMHRHDPKEGTGGLLTDVVNDPIRPSMMVSPPDPRVEEQNRLEVEAIEAELRIPLAERYSNVRERVRKWDEANTSVYMTSWHTKEIDSDFMWRVYGKYEYGFAVVSSVQDVVEAIAAGGLDRSKIGCGFVVYPTRDELIRDKYEDMMGSYASFMIKSPQHAQENELRVFVKAIRAVRSCDLKVALPKLVHRIRISPFVPRWALKPLLDTLNPICDEKGVSRVQHGIGSIRDSDACDDL
jgi:hypothetical protein